MDIATAEAALARHVAQLGGLTEQQTVCGAGGIPESPPMVLVRFVSGKLAASALTDLVAEVRGVFAEPAEAQAFASAVWGALPEYGAAGFAELAAEGGVELGTLKSGCWRKLTPEEIRLLTGEE